MLLASECVVCEQEKPFAVLLAAGTVSLFSIFLHSVTSKLYLSLIIDIGKNFLAFPTGLADICLVLVQNRPSPGGFCVYFLLCNSRQDYGSLWS